MIPKVETCIYALEQGVEGVVILDGQVPHAVLLELFTDHGAGTLMHEAMSVCHAAAMGPEPTMTSRPCRVLLVYPRFVPNSFWNYKDACKLVGALYPAAPLGLITVAALLPAGWEFRLVDRNTEELNAADIDWADLVLTGGMLNQQPDTLRSSRSATRAANRSSLVGPM